MDRRKFLRSIVGLAATAVVAPVALAAATKPKLFEGRVGTIYGFTVYSGPHLQQVPRKQTESLFLRGDGQWVTAFPPQRDQVQELRFIAGS